MMRNLILSILLAVAVVISSPSVSFAQNVQPNPGINNSQGAVQDNTDENTGFDWRWLIPLAAIPLLFLAFRGSDDREEYRETRYTGAKGGRSDTPPQGWTQSHEEHDTKRDKEE